MRHSFQLAGSGHSSFSSMIPDLMLSRENVLDIRRSSALQSTEEN
jgi:hypothetical protein